jgi:hypothetical protein
MTEGDAGGLEPADSGEAVVIVLAAIDTSALTSQVVETAARLTRRTWPSAELHLLHVAGHLALGDPSQEIVRRARALGADLLVVGAHDTAGLQRLLVGSVAEKVAKRAPCSVLMVRRKQRPYKKVE